MHAAEDFGPYGRRRDRAVASALAATGAELQLVGSSYAVTPGRFVRRRARRTGCSPRSPGLGSLMDGIRRRRRRDRRRGPKGCAATAFRSRLASTLPSVGRGGGRQARRSPVLGPSPRRLRRAPEHPRFRRHVSAVAIPALGLPAPRQLLAELGTGRSARRFVTNCAGESSTPTSCSTIPTRHGGHGGLGSDRAARRRAVGRRALRRGRRASPATRSSMPACGSCSPRRGCTTGSASSLPASS